MADERPCPMCGELVLAAAKKCRFCGEWFDEAARDEVRGRGQEQRQDAPLVLKVWGGLLMGCNALMGALLLVGCVITIAQLRAPSSAAGPQLAGFVIGTLLGCGLVLVMPALFIRMGWGLWKGQRSAVVGLGVLGVLGVGLCVVMVALGARTEAAVMLGLTLVACAPPVVIGATTWARLK
jgi:hypothetical protein